MDGTQIDSEPTHLSVLLAVCAAADVDPSNLPDDHFVGVALPDVWTALAPCFRTDVSWRAWADAIEMAYL